MVRGISKQECPVFNLEIYKDFEDAKVKVTDFLTKNKLGQEL